MQSPTLSFSQGRSPPEVVKHLQRVDWETIDLALAIALIFRMVWIWDLRCEQFNERVYLVGDEELYRRLRGALFIQTRRKFHYALLLKLTEELAPAQLPGYHHESCRDRSFQSRIYRDFQTLASKIATVADMLVLKSESTDTAAVVYAFDRVLGWYRMDAARLAAKKGKAASTQRPHPQKDAATSRFRGYRLLRSRQTFQKDAGINAAIFAARRTGRPRPSTAIRPKRREVMWLAKTRSMEVGLRRCPTAHGWRLTVE